MALSDVRLNESTFRSVDKTELKKQSLLKACRDFEAILLHEILKGMRKAMPGGGSRQEALYRSIFDEQISRVCAARGLGLANLLYSGLEKSLYLTDPNHHAKAFHRTADKIDVSPRHGVKR
jgi:Rod binding domain-containing protein